MCYLKVPFLATGVASSPIRLSSRGRGLSSTRTVYRQSVPLELHRVINFAGDTTNLGVRSRKCGLSSRPHLFSGSLENRAVLLLASFSSYSWKYFVLVRKNLETMALKLDCNLF